MAKEVELDHRAIDAFLKSPQVAADLKRRADAIASAAGGAPGYVAESFIGKSRARASVRTATAKAARAEAKNHGLITALDAGR